VRNEVLDGQVSQGSLLPEQGQSHELRAGAMLAKSVRFAYCKSCDGECWAGEYVRWRTTMPGRSIRSTDQSLEEVLKVEREQDEADHHAKQHREE